MFKLLLCIFIGGGLGSVSRYSVGLLFARYVSFSFPLATLTVNILGSFLIGLFWGSLSISEKSQLVHLLIIGFCGGFTTFSAFSWENVMLLKEEEVLSMILYTSASLLFCLLSTWGGYSLGKMISF